MREARTGAAVESNSYVIENERAFVALLISDIQAFNENFVEREEQCVIQLSLLEEKALAAQEADEVASVYKVTLVSCVSRHCLRREFIDESDQRRGTSVN